MSRSTRTLLAVMLFVLAAIMIVNLIVRESHLNEWLLPVLLAVVGLGLALYPDRRPAFAPETPHTLHGITPPTPKAVIPPPETEFLPEDEVAKEPQLPHVDIPEVHVDENPWPSHKPPVPATVTEDHHPSPIPQAYETQDHESSRVSEAVETHNQETVLVEDEATETTATNDTPSATADQATPVEEKAPEPIAPATATPTSQAQTDAPAVPNEPSTPASEAADDVPATPAGPDDLTVVEGIGAKMSAALHAAGISTYAALAAASEETLRDAISAAGMRFAPSLPTWSRQAEYAANGDWDGLRAYQSELTAGRKN